MNIDNLINTAFDGNRTLQGEGLFILEGNPERNMFRIIPADQAFKDNLTCFVYKINTGFQFLGIYITEKEAELDIEFIRQNFRDEQGNRLI